MPIHKLYFPFVTLKTCHDIILEVWLWLILAFFTQFCEFVQPCLQHLPFLYLVTIKVSDAMNHKALRIVEIFINLFSFLFNLATFYSSVCLLPFADEGIYLILLCFIHLILKFSCSTWFPPLFSALLVKKILIPSITNHFKVLFKKYFRISYYITLADMYLIQKSSIKI